MVWHIVPEICAEFLLALPGFADKAMAEFHDAARATCVFFRHPPNARKPAIQTKHNTERMSHDP
jgi:hypothetical protein